MLNHQLLLLVVFTAIPRGNWGYNYSFCEFGACGHTYMCEEKESFVVAASSSAAMVVKHEEAYANWEGARVLKSWVWKHDEIFKWREKGGVFGIVKQTYVPSKV